MKSGSVTVRPPNGCTGVVSLVVWSRVSSPPSTGESVEAVTATLLWLSLATPPAVSATLTMKPVVVTLPGGATCTSGWNTRASIAACTGAPMPGAGLNRRV